MTAPAVGIHPMPPAQRIDVGDTIRFNTADVHAARDQADTAELVELVRWAYEEAETDPVLASDLGWMLTSLDLCRKTTDQQLRDDLNAIILSRPPYGTLGDRVAEAMLAATERLIERAWRDLDRGAL